MSKVQCWQTMQARLVKLNQELDYFSSKGHSLVKTGAELSCRNTSPSNNTLVLHNCSLRIMQFLGLSFLLMDSSLFFSFIPIQKRILLGSVTLLFQQILATGGHTLSASAVLDTPAVPAVESPLSQHLLCTGVDTACRSHRSMVSTSLSLRSFFCGVYWGRGKGRGFY